MPQTAPPFRGAKRWRCWCHEPPRSDGLVEAWRREWTDAEVIDVRRVHPAMNVAYLFWCPLSQPTMEPEVRRK